jgi:hypothetical protein
MAGNQFLQQLLGFWQCDMDKHQTNSKYIRLVMVYSVRCSVTFPPLIPRFSQEILIPYQNTCLALLSPIQRDLSKGTQSSQSVWIGKHLHPSRDDMDSTPGGISCRGRLHSDYRKLLEIGSRGAEMSWLLMLLMGEDWRGRERYQRNVFRQRH